MRLTREKLRPYLRIDSKVQPSRDMYEVQIAGGVMSTVKISDSDTSNSTSFSGQGDEERVDQCDCKLSRSRERRRTEGLVRVWVWNGRGPTGSPQLGESAINVFLLLSMAAVGEPDDLLIDERPCLKTFHKDFGSLPIKHRSTRLLSV